MCRYDYAKLFACRAYPSTYIGTRTTRYLSMRRFFVCRSPVRGRGAFAVTRISAGEYYLNTRAS